MLTVADNPNTAKLSLSSLCHIPFRICSISTFKNPLFITSSFLFFRKTSNLLFVYHMCYSNTGNIKHFLNVINWGTLIGCFLVMSHGWRWKAESEKQLICRGSAWQKKMLIFFLCVVNSYPSCSKPVVWNSVSNYIVGKNVRLGLNRRPTLILTEK